MKSSYEDVRSTISSGSTAAGLTVEADAPVCTDCDKGLVSRHGCLWEPLYSPESLVRLSLSSDALTTLNTPDLCLAIISTAEKVSIRLPRSNPPK
jgi:hypothetical protein